MWVIHAPPPNLCCLVLVLLLHVCVHVQHMELGHGCERDLHRPWTVTVRDPVICKGPGLWV